MWLQTMVNGLLIGVNQIAVAIRRICGSQYKLIRVKPVEVQRILNGRVGLAS
jgi:hypothetical protein